MGKAMTEHCDLIMEDKRLQGWVKLYRQMLESAIWKKPHLVKLFVYCLLRANYKDAMIPHPSITCPVKVEAGQFICGMYTLHFALYGAEIPSSQPKPRDYRSPKTVWKYLATLQDLGMVTLKSGNRFTVVTVVNWERYQSGKTENVQQPSNRRETEEKQASTDKKVKKEKKAKKKPPQQMPTVPPELREIWADWTKARKEIGKPLTATAAKRQLKTLGEFDTETAIQIIELSIMNNWQGIFPDRFRKPSQAKPTKTTAERLGIRDDEE